MLGRFVTPALTSFHSVVAFSLWKLLMINKGEAGLLVGELLMELGNGVLHVAIVFPPLPVVKG